MLHTGCLFLNEKKITSKEPATKRVKPLRQRRDASGRRDKRTSEKNVEKKLHHPFALTLSQFFSRVERYKKIYSLQRMFANSDMENANPL